MYLHNKGHPQPVVRIHTRQHTPARNTVTTSSHKIHEATDRLSNENYLAWVPRTGEQNEIGEYKSHEWEVRGKRAEAWCHAQAEWTELSELAMIYHRYTEQLITTGKHDYSMGQYAEGYNTEDN